MKAAIIGGDKRMLYTAKAFFDSGFEVTIAGFVHLQSQCGMRVTSIKDALGWADFSVLPIRPLNGKDLNCPFADEQLNVELFSLYQDKKPVFCGNAQQLSGYLHAPLRDYAAREDFALRNAVLTAEGAIELICSQYEDSLFGAKILVLGYGRIGKALSRDLKPLGAEVTVAARKTADRVLAETQGIPSLDYSSIELYSYEIIINTVPALILNADRIDALHDDVFLIDLASAPGGMDTKRIKERGLSYHHALGLPAKTAPKAAGRIIKDTIIQIIKEENGGKDNAGLGNDRLLLHL